MAPSVSSPSFYILMCFLLSLAWNEFDCLSMQEFYFPPNLPPNNDVNGEPLSVVLILRVILSVDYIMVFQQGLDFKYIEVQQCWPLMEIHDLTVQGPWSL